MRIRLTFPGLCLAIALSYCSTARGQTLPSDLRGLDFTLSGTVTLGGKVLGSAEEASFSFNDVVLDIVADPSHPNDPSHIEVNTILPAPNTPGNAGQNLSLHMFGTYNQANGAFNVQGTHTGDVFVDTGIVDNNYLLKNGQEIWARLRNAQVDLNGTVSGQGNQLLINGLDNPPKSGGPSTNLSVSQADIRWVDVGNLDPTQASTIISISNPYGGVSGNLGPHPSWQAQIVTPAPSALTVFLPGLLASLTVIRRRRRCPAP